MRFVFSGVPFGGPSGDLLVTGFVPGAADRRNGDTDRPNGDGVILGRDFVGSSTWAFDLVTNRKNVEDALKTAATFGAEWNKEKTRLKPGATVPLSYEMGGRWRRVFGRPGKYVGPIGTVRAKLGVGEITCDFRVTDPLFYTDAESSAVLTIVPASTGGLMAPLVAPLSTVRSSAPRVGLVANQGDASTPLRVEFRGPIVDPYIRAAAGWRVSINGSLAYDDVVVVDARAGTVTKNGSPAAGMLNRVTRLSAAKLPAGASELTFGGTDLTGTATATIRWRDAFTSI